MATLESFRCEKRLCSLSMASCVASWNAAQKRRPEPWEGLWHCRSCPIGAAHAGKPMSNVAGPSDALRCICPRCLRWSPRRVGAMGYCVSCYNRNREVRVGRNAKGSQPRLQLHTVGLAVARDGAAQREHVADVVSTVEAMMILAKAAATPVVFGRPGMAR